MQEEKSEEKLENELKLLIVIVQNLKDVEEQENVIRMVEHSNQEESLEGYGGCFFKLKIQWPFLRRQSALSICSSQFFQPLQSPICLQAAVQCSCQGLQTLPG